MEHFNPFTPWLRRIHYQDCSLCWFSVKIGTSWHILHQFSYRSRHR